MVFVGDPTTLDAPARELLTRRGALIHDGSRASAELSLATYFAGGCDAEHPPLPARPYTYTAPPERVPAERLHAYIDALHRRTP